MCVYIYIYISYWRHQPVSASEQGVSTCVCFAEVVCKRTGCGLFRRSGFAEVVCKRHVCVSPKWFANDMCLFRRSGLQTYRALIVAVLSATTVFFIGCFSIIVVVIMIIISSSSRRSSSSSSSSNSSSSGTCADYLCVLI